jgi:hypothetical protein
VIANVKKGWFHPLKPRHGIQGGCDAALLDRPVDRATLLTEGSIRVRAGERPIPSNRGSARSHTRIAVTPVA